MQSPCKETVVMIGVLGVSRENTLPWIDKENVNRADINDQLTSRMLCHLIR